MHRSLSTRLSRRALTAVAVLLVLAATLVVLSSGPEAAADGPPRPALPALPVADALAKTVAEPLAHVRLDLTPRAGPRLTIAGIAGLASDDADLSLTLDGRESGRFRSIGEQAWIGTPDLGWVPVDADHIGSEATSWRPLLRRLRAGPAVTLAGHPATVELDGQGRIRRVRAVLPRSTFDLRLDGYDEDLVITPPP